jgi:hypothetical protein
MAGPAINMTNGAAMRRTDIRSVLGFLTLALIGAACGGSLAPAPDGGPAGGGVCSLPFDPGPCEAAIGVVAFVDGTCVMRTYGGCEGNGNRFNTLEECLASCVGAGACPPNRVAREICLACGPAGGCAKKATACALVCDPDGGASPCEPLLPVCYQGVCQNAFCI